MLKLRCTNKQINKQTENVSMPDIEKIKLFGAIEISHHGRMNK